ncbi:MAG TPA: tetratricopeptide repeat protein, partial [Burkholderiaceae bacterium]|nr:tetratricopeptide repeat protein [Burkholderiaceae bacterium]
HATRDRANRFGGSHAQRDLLSLTLIEAARRAGAPALARHILAERQTLKPTAWSERLARRLDRPAPARQPAAA